MSAAASPTAADSGTSAQPRVPPTLGRGVAIALLYAAVFLVAGVLSGVDYDEITESSSNVLGFVVIPVGLGIVATLAVSARWGWWRALFFEDERLTSPRWIRALPVLFGLVILVTLIAAPWDEWTVGLVLLVLLGTLMVGFGEEIVFRGYVLVGARGSMSEVGAWFVSTSLFALVHGLNIITGQAVGTTIQQMVFAFIMGTGLYFIRRATGLLVVGMVIHGLWDFSTFIGSGRGDDGTGIPAGAYAAPFVWAALAVSIAAAIVVFRRARATA